MRVRAKKELGQHFLVDENILGVIGRLAQLEDDDIVLEVGPGLGILTTYLADRVRQVYAIELDTSLGPRLVERLAGRPNVELRFGDALQLDLAAEAPGSNKVVANLPYNIATPLIVESLDRLPAVAHWTVMVQREVADRLFAHPSTNALDSIPCRRRCSDRAPTSNRRSSPFAAPAFRPTSGRSSASSKARSRIAASGLPIPSSLPASPSGRERRRRSRNLAGKLPCGPRS
jgi:hypothetical protein